MLNNVLDNAVKYTPEGGRIDVSLEHVVIGTALHARVVVVDSGPGIPASERERVFDRFYRGEPASGFNPPGSGLGLAIVRRIAERHGARVTLGDANAQTGMRAGEYAAGDAHLDSNHHAQDIHGPHDVDLDVRANEGRGRGLRVMIDFPLTTQPGLAKTL
jgi:signal transduction histidine kinase